MLDLANVEAIVLQNRERLAKKLFIIIIKMLKFLNKIQKLVNNSSMSLEKKGRILVWIEW